MATDITSKPVPDYSYEVAKRNLEDLDKFENQTSGTVTFRNENVVRPLPVLVEEMEAIIADADAVGGFATAAAESAASASNSATTSTNAANTSVAARDVAVTAANTALAYPDGQVVAHLNVLKSIERKCTELFNFADEDYGYYDAATLAFTKSPISDAMSVVRASTATANHPQGLVTYPVNGLRIAYDRLTGERLGALVERSRTRLNTISALPTAPEAVTVTAAAHPISFSGTGSVTLSGAATGTLTGAGSEVVSLTFTPTAGALTITPSGSVINLQLELGAFPSSRIVGGEGAQVIRSNDGPVKTLGVTNALQGTLLCEFMCTGISADGLVKPILSLNNSANTTNRGLRLAVTTDNRIIVQIRDAAAGAVTTINSGVTAVSGVWYRVSIGFDDVNNTASISVNGSAVVTGANNNSLSGNNTHLFLQGSSVAGGVAGWLPTIYRVVGYAPRALTNAEYVSWSKP